MAATPGRAESRHDRPVNQRRVLAPGVVVGDDGEIREFAHGASHQLPLAAIPVAAAAEHDEDAPVAQFADRLDRGAQAAVGVGVVDENRKLLAAVHRLQPAVRGLLRGHRGADRVRRHSQGVRRRDRRRQVLEVEPAEQPADERETEPGRLDLGPNAREVEVRPDDAHLGIVPAGAAAAPHPGRPSDFRGQPAAVLVVDVDHRGTARAKQGEEPALGPVVGLHRGVIVEMVAAEIREHGGVEAHPVQPPLIERMRRHLDGRGPRSQVHRPSEHPKQVAALRRRPVGSRGTQRARVGAPGSRHVHPPAQGPDHRGRSTGLGQAGTDQLGGRRLAVGAGDPDGQELPLGVVVEPCGHRPHLAPWIVDLQPGNGRRGGRRSEGEDSGGAAGYGIGRESPAIVDFAPPGDEEVAASDAPGVVLNPRDFRVGRGKAQL